MSGDYDDLVTTLQAVEEELADRAIDVLRTAIEAGADRGPAEERRLLRARRAVAKAIAELEGPRGDLDD